jgi:hypothetical protein
MPTAVGNSTVPKGTVRSRPYLKMAVRLSTDHQPERVDRFICIVSRTQKQGEVRTQNGPGLRLSKRNPADDTSLGVSNVGHKIAQQSTS